MGKMVAFNSYSWYCLLSDQSAEQQTGSYFCKTVKFHLKQNLFNFMQQ